MAANWPITAADLRKELQIAPGSDDEDELELYVAVACERIDANTGRDLEPSRHEKGGNLPRTFILAARAAAVLWWRQSKNGPRNRPGGPPGGAAVDVAGPPAGIDLPSKVKGWLTPYPPRLYPPEKPVFAPVTLTWSNGTTLALSRAGDIVTMVATPGAPNVTPVAQNLPDGYAPAGNLSAYLLQSPASIPTAGNWFVQIQETTGGISTVNVGAFNSGPWAAFTAQWLADPA